ncbi:peptidylprolyl isomerase [Aquabacter spiritensis]|uniref:Periplasmic chaperone for outer membrane proteins SurA n=1 Tax=Aquabacter spiritensis TaxID=933073 RepID=A0A4V2UXW4_9HYPH|nr:SurA N-terminal domain-containing protein [Aquabacter spiritensis]TCT05088.1 periplasmic chaperone for outer membrane proteins SurA [Aquabacter spiritensis]
MLKSFRLLTILGLAFLSAGFATSAYAQQILVMVNGRPITTYDVAQRQKLHTIIENKAPGAKETLEELIDERIKVQTAARLGIEVDSEELDRIYAGVAQRTGRTAEQLTSGLAQQGLDVRTFKDKLRADNVWQQYVRAKAPAINVRDSDVLALLSRDGTTDLVATEYKLYPIIFVVPRGSSNHGARLAEANAFKARFSDCDVGLQAAKDMREVVVRSPVLRLSSDMPGPLRQMLDKTEVGRLTPPEVTQHGVEIFAVCGKTPVKGESFKKRDIKEQLASNQFQVESKKLMADLRKSALIIYR